MKKLICLCFALASLETAPALAGWFSNDDVPGFARENFPHWLSLDFMNTYANHAGENEHQWPTCQYSTRDLILMEFGMRGNYNPVHRITTDGSDTKIYGEYEADPRLHNPRQSREVIRSRKEDGRCKIEKGRWVDFYTGEQISDPSLAEVDHVVALKDAWNSGASKWTLAKREEFANDTLNLTIASKTTNTKKSAYSITEMNKWMDRDSVYACEYVNRYVSVKNKYRLSYSSDEISIIKDFHKKTIKWPSGKKSRCLVKTAFKETLTGWDLMIPDNRIRK